jgi:hypothetical protein
MNSLDIIEQAVRREITSEQAADLLMKQRRRAPQKPAWMPKAVPSSVTASSGANRPPSRSRLTFASSVAIFSVVIASLGGGAPGISGGAPGNLSSIVSVPHLRDVLRRASAITVRAVPIGARLRLVLGGATKQVSNAKLRLKQIGDAIPLGHREVVRVAR